jgi:gamma-glutamylcyclotransferase (GGCT)/AIG2-like uncharacterized protein YtfP
MLYFAYGSNINQDHMLQRCPTHIYVGTGSISNFTLYFGGTSLYWNGGAFAAIRKQRDGIVWGVLYDLNKEEFEELDRIENVPHDYLRRSVIVTDASGMDISAFVYMASEVPVGCPSLEYLRTIRQGAYAVGLPLHYIKEFFDDT